MSERLLIGVGFKLETSDEDRPEDVS